MFTPAITRLLWKDARTLAPVWLALLATAVAMQALFVYSAWLNPTARWYDGHGRTWTTLLPVLLTVGLPLGFAYAAAAAGILFAGEVEERTDEWLRVLPIPPRTLAAAKLGVGLGTLGLFLAACTVSGGMAAVIHAGWPRGLDVRGVDLAATFGMIAMAVAAALTTGLFLSVQMRRVIAVVAGTLIGALPLFPVGDWLATDVFGVSGEFGAPVLFAGLAALDVWLVLRWCRGDATAIDWPRLKQQCESAAGWAVLTRVMGKSLPNRLVGTVHPMRWLLRRAATLGCPGLRGLAVLLWQEARVAGRFSAIWITVGLVCLLPVILSQSRWGVVSVLWLLAGLYFACTPGLCGMLAAGGDRHRDQRLFLGHRGVSATTAWFAKQATWLTLACVLTLGWAWAQHELFVEHARSNRVLSFAVTLTDAIRVPSRWDGPGQFAPTAADVMLRRQFALTLLVSLYAVGQLCGFWFRSAIVGGGVAIAWSLIVAAWLYLATMSDVPLWMSAGPLVLLWLAATWRSMDDWLVDRRDRSRTLRRVAWTLVPVLAAIVMFSVARRTQIPWVEVNDHWDAAAMRAVHRSWNSAWLTQTKQQQPLAPTSAQRPPMWADLRDRMAEFVSAADAPDAAISPGELDASLHAFAESLRPGGYDTPSPLPLVSPTGWEQTVTAYAERRAEAMQQSGERAAAFQLLIDGLTILREVRESPLDEYAAVGARQDMFRRVAAWGQDPLTTADDLRQARESSDFRFETGFNRWLNPAVYVIEMENLVQRFYGMAPEELSRLNADLHSWPSFKQWVWRAAQTADNLLGERVRVERFLRICRNNAELLALRDRYPERLIDSDRFVPRADIERWAATTGPLRWASGLRSKPFADGVVSLVQGLTLQGQTELACERGVQILLALELYRRDEGRYPEQLSQLLPKYLKDLPVDPFTGAEFEYVANGLDAPWLLDARLAYSEATWREGNPPQVPHEPRTPDDAAASPRRLRVIPAGQPFLYSRGPNNGGRVWQSYPVAGDRNAAGNRGGGLYREVTNGQIDGGGPSSGSPPGSSRVAAARAEPGAAPAFVVLGVNMTPWGTMTESARP